MTTWPSGRPKPQLRDWIPLAVVLAVISGVILYLAYEEKKADRAFNAMSPAQHLEAAKLALKEKRFDDGLRHTKAIAAGTPEAIAVKTLTDEINTEVANVLAERKSAEERSAQDRQLSEQRAAVVRDLQDKLRNLGYDLTVGESDKPEELIITSKDFDQTDQRVRFLSFLRGRTNPATDVCLLGFRVVNLRTSALPLVGFSEKYVLGCF